jgi:hypothetical protein
MLCPYGSSGIAPQRPFDRRWPGSLKALVMQLAVLAVHYGENQHLQGTPAAPAMNFLSLIYGLFLLCVVGLYWSVPNPRLRSWVLLLASLLFYATLQIQYIPLLLVATWITFALGRAIGTPPNWRIEDWQYAQQDWNRRRIKLLWLGIGLNLVLLLSFKYVPFALSGLGAALKLPLVPPGTTWKSLSLLAPIGLSFFSFECIAYLVDVYRGAPAAQTFIRFAAYKLFFAKLISGPVTRYPQFADQLQTLKLPAADQITEGLWLIACGAVKKGLIADRLGGYVNLTFDNLQRAGSGDIGLATLCYGFQLYLDFSGYVDVARGSALLAALAHDPGGLAAQLPVFPPGRIAPGPGADLCQFDHCHAAGGPVAWGGLGLRDLGRAPWVGPGGPPLDRRLGQEVGPGGGVLG